MKKIIKGLIPPSLASYVSSNPCATWEGMKQDAFGGILAYSDVKNQLFKDQGGICAYCETALNASAKPFRGEHFHPKSAGNAHHNWHLDWNNLLATCNGGEDEKNSYQLPQNLSCDAVKKDALLDGYILNPLLIEPFPAVFRIDRLDGKLLPNEAYCKQWPDISYNKFPTTRELIENTIDKLNLNCNRLCNKRLQLIESIENKKKEFKNKKIKALEAMTKIAEHYFSKQWPPFFTTIRYALGQYGEDYLRTTNYGG